MAILPSKSRMVLSKVRALPTMIGRKIDFFVFKIFSNMQTQYPIQNAHVWSSVSVPAAGAPKTAEVEDKQMMRVGLKIWKGDIFYLIIKP